MSWVLIGDRPHQPGEIARVTGVPVAAVLPDDRRGAQAMLEGRADGRGKRSRLARAITALATETSCVSPPSDDDEPHAMSGQPSPDAESVPLAALAGDVAR